MTNFIKMTLFFSTAFYKKSVFKSAFLKTTLFIALSASTSMLSFAHETTRLVLSNTNPEEPTISLYQEDKLVSTKIMTKEHFSLYETLKVYEGTMEAITDNLGDFHEKMKDYSKQLNILSKQIVESSYTKNKDNAIHKKQHELQRQIAELTKKHQPTFDKMEQQGKHITKAADKFEVALKEYFDIKQFDTLQIYSDNSI